jgi:hypothetical protein
VSGRWRRGLANLGALAFGVGLALLLGEIGFRILGYLPSAVRPDPVVGARWIPGAAYRWKVEGHSEGRMNHAGWRDRDYPETKPKDTTRILVVGDSYVQGLEVPLDSTFHKRLEGLLDAHARAPHRFEVLALGRGGFGTTEEYLVYRNWGVRYQPDVVVLLFVLNDWADNWHWPGSGWVRPSFVEEGDSLRLDTSFARSPHFRRMQWLSWIKEHSSLATEVADRYQKLRARVRPDSMEQGLVFPQGWYTSWNVDRFPAADSVPAMRLTAKILGKFSDQVHRDGRRFVVVVTGIDLNLIPQFMTPRAGDPNYDPDKTTRFLRDAGNRYGFEVISLVPEFRAWSAHGGPRPNWGEGWRYGHWNNTGHEIAARTIFARLAPTLPGLEPVPADTGLAITWPLRVASSATAH